MYAPICFRLNLQRSLKLCLVSAIGVYAAPAFAQGTVFEVDPGLWRFEESFSIPGMRVEERETITECLSSEQARRSLAQIVDEMTGGSDSDCSVSNISVLPGKVSLDITCDTNADGLRMQSVGHMAYEYDRISYTGGATGEISVQGQKLSYTGHVKANRVGVCEAKD